MARKKRQASSVGLYHVITRGNNKGTLFHRKQDFDEFLEILAKYLKKLPIKLNHYCLMTNHIHLLLWAENTKILSHFMHRVERGYYRYYHKNYIRIGHLFQGRYYSLPIEDEAYLLDCGRYIERNPVRAGMVQDPKDWKYSSYGVYAYGFKNDLVSVSIAYNVLSEDENIRRELYRKRVEIARPYETMIDRRLVDI